MNEITKYEPKKSKYRPNRAQIIDLLILSPVVAILLVAGACKAYDTIMGNILEDNYRNAVTAQNFADKNYEAARTAHCSALAALVQWKKDNNIAVKGTDTECDILQ